VCVYVSNIASSYGFHGNVWPVARSRRSRPVCRLLSCIRRFGFDCSYHYGEMIGRKVCLVASPLLNRSNVPRWETDRT